MYLEEPDELLALRRQLRRYFAELLTDGVRAALRDPARAPGVVRDLVRRMGADGWLTVGWPAEHGGGGRGPRAQLVFFDEVLRAGAPYPLVTVNTVGPALMRYGTAEQKARFLPGIARGEIHFAIGYTEPQAGTDLASLRTRAVRDGDHYVVDGNKVFTSGIDVADWVWLACRTDPSVPKHEGISILLVDVRSEGFSWTPIETVGGVTTSATYYDGLRVPIGNLVGPEGGGWRIMTTQLNHERVTLGANSGLAYELADEVRAWAAATPMAGSLSEPTPGTLTGIAAAAVQPTTGTPIAVAAGSVVEPTAGSAAGADGPPAAGSTTGTDGTQAAGAVAGVGVGVGAGSAVGAGGRWVLDEPWVRQDLARVHARLEAVRLLNWRMAAAMEAGDPAPGDSSLVKVFATESLIEVYRLLLGIVGPQGHLPAGTPGAVLAGRLERAGRQAQINTFGGGVNEVQRELLAARALLVGRRAG